MSFKELLSNELEFNFDITFEEATNRFPGITRTNFDLIKYEYRRDVLGLIPKKKTKIEKKSKNYTNKNGKSNFHEQKKIEKLNANTVEKIILDMLNKESTIPESQIRIAVDFMVKVKKAVEGDELLIDAKYLTLAESEEGVEYHPDDKVKVELNMDEFLKIGYEAGEKGHQIPDPEFSEDEKTYSDKK